MINRIIFKLPYEYTFNDLQFVEISLAAGNSKPSV